MPHPSEDQIIGAFRLICQPGHLNWDDAIVYPGQIGASPHLHQWFGNSLANGESTYRSLRTTGESSCMGPINRSAYWIPAMYNGANQVIRPDYISVYYKRIPKSSAECGKNGENCQALPRGLRYIFGYDMRRIGQAQPENLNFWWKCLMPNQEYRGGLEKSFDKLDCKPGDIMIVTLAAPDCWDGKYLDSTDHRSHIVNRQNNPYNGRAECPATHPIILPEFTIGVAYTVHPGESIKDWFLASDRMTGMPSTAPGGSFHADWYGAWDDDALKTWTENCIDKLLSCSAGELGDGTIMKRPANYGLVASPRLVTPPVRPGIHSAMKH